MPTHRAMSWAPIRLLLATSLLSAGLHASPLDSLLVPPAVVRLVLPESPGSCFAGLDREGLAIRLGDAIDSSEWLRLDSAASEPLSLAYDRDAGECGLSLTLVRDSTDSIVAHAGVPAGETVASSDVLERLVWQISQDLGARTGSWTFATDPPGAKVLLAGLEAGATPLRVAGLRPGRVPVRIEAHGWNEVSGTLTVVPGESRSWGRSLERSRAWLDSVRHEELAVRSDSVWKDARAHPSRDLPELFDRLALGIATDPWVSVAILPFDVLGGHEDDYDPGTMAAEYGLARWKRDPRFVVLRREAVRRFVKSGAFGKTGSVSDSATAEMGKSLAARYMVTGAIKVAAGKTVLGARMVSVRTGEVVSAAVAEIPTADAEDLYREALGEKGRLQAVVSRSVLVPGWGQLHAGRPVHAGIAFGAVAASLGFAVWAYADYADKDDELQRFRDRDLSTVVEGEERGGWWRRAEAARIARNDAASLFGLSLFLAGGAWIGNVVDAGIIGWMESRRILPKYYAFVPSPVARPDGLSLAWGF